MADLLFTVENGIAKIVLNRPERMNAFSEEMIDLWIQALETVRDSDEIRVVLVKGNGKSFCAGGDVKEMMAGNGFYKSDEDRVSTGLARKNSLWKKVQRVPLLLEEIDKPVIAQMHGSAFGAGLDMALMCDIRIVSEEAKLSESYVNVGLVPGDGAAYFLPRLAGIDQALDLLWTGKVLTAAEAKEKGMVTYVVSEEELESFTEKYLKKLASGPQQSIRFIKRAVYQNQTMSLRASLDMISSSMAIATELEDYQEGVRALVEKRKPNFK
ncbi:enoyl-CoA hydratase/isomerase family protein [Cytobacillus purgationiresistens]|uniref:Enoyl-CoA hydratase/carnithine racemase n=1 Tax=Cytobacillus purgationiresistens TaxID=863449 RepID=A0ABU0AH50_9BACI|nr:enoyl-CoA hydratase-related protein [Cytobacillus purgationiresistens]MDQ0269748.1 enoyl-CoA hydratase/carnithine racemase [Cytobacillus purgationiresistens]